VVQDGAEQVRLGLSCGGCWVVDWGRVERRGRGCCAGHGGGRLFVGRRVGMWEEVLGYADGGADGLCGKGV
jgi:hypothetical protein